MPRKTKAVRELEQRLAYALESQRDLHRQLSVKDDQHKKELEKVREQVKEKRIEQVTRLINAVGQTQESIGRALSLLLDSPGY